MPLLPWERTAYTHVLAAAQTHLPAERWQVVFAAGQAMTLEQAIAYALEETNPV